MATRVPWLLLSSLVAACAGAPERPAANTSDVPRDLASAGDLPAAFDAPPPDATDDTPADDAAQGADSAAYPAGPYGTSVGQVLADMRLEGFVNPTAEGLASERPLRPTSMAALRGAGRGYAVVFVAEFL